MRQLTSLYNGSALSEKSTEFLLGTKARTVTMPERLGALLPRNTPIAHKTGTVGGVANDAGYITLPDGRRFAIVVFTRGSDTPPADRERAVAGVEKIRPCNGPGGSAWGNPCVCNLVRKEIGAALSSILQFSGAPRVRDPLRSRAPVFLVRGRSHSNQFESLRPVHATRLHEAITPP